MGLDKIYPLTFRPIYKEYVWGGTKLFSIKKEKQKKKIAESWEVCDREEGESLVEKGFYEGYSLKELLREKSALVLGKEEKQFPLLIKLIDSAENLSIQVHPSQDSSKITKAEPKTEMWYILEAEKKAAIYAGFQKEIPLEKRKELLGKKEMLSYLRKIPVKKGDVVFIPGGRVHAILQGCFLLEVQQNSNTTYRIYDWERKEKNRPLHYKESFETILWEDIQSPLCSPLLEEEGEGFQKFLCLQTPFFSLRKYTIQQETTFPLAKKFHVFFLIEGKAFYKEGEKWIEMELLRAYFWPACLLQITVKGIATLLCVSS